MRKEKRDKLLVRLADMIDAHSGNWSELCELQELVKELRSHPYNEQSIRQDERERVLDKLEAWRVQKISNIHNPCSLENTNSAFGELEGKLKELRQEGKQEQPCK